MPHSKLGGIRLPVQHLLSVGNAGKSPAQVGAGTGVQRPAEGKYKVSGCHRGFIPRRSSRRPREDKR